jgi:hypothetical protein
MCGTQLPAIDVEHRSIALQAIAAGRDLLLVLDQAQLFWRHEEVQPLFEALTTGHIFEEAPIDVLTAISERIFYYLTDAVPAYEPILRKGPTDDHPAVDPALEQARRLWEAIRTFRDLRQTAFDYATASAFCRRQAGD